MKILTNSNNIVTAIGSSITFGVFDEPFEKWKIESEEYYYYMIDNNFTLYEVEVTEEIKEIKYCYTEEKGFYLNTEYTEPISIEQEVKKLTEENLVLKTKLENVQEVLDYLVMK